MSTLQKTSRPRLLYLDGLRALAALFVLFNHTYITIWNDQNNLLPPVHLRGVLGILQNGHYAVDLFIVLSGYCLMLPVVFGEGILRGGAVRFFKKRARRILPPYYAILLISLLLSTTILSTRIGTAWDVGLPLTAYGLITHFLLIQDILSHDTGQLGYQLWTIPVEWHIYFLFPLLVIGWRKLGGWRTTLTVFAIACLCVKFLKYLPATAFPYPYVALFAFGMMGAVISFSRERTWQDLCGRIPWGMVAFGIAGLIALTWVINPHRASMYTNYIDFLVGICSMSVCIAAAHSQGWLSRFLNWKPLVAVGGFSFSLYLVHVAALTVIWRYGLRPLHLSDVATFTLLALLGAPLVVGISYLFHLAFERPFMGAPPPRTERQAEIAAITSPAP